MNKIIKLSPTLLFICGIIVTQLLPTTVAFLVFGLLIVGYILFMPMFLERYKLSNDFNYAVTINYYLLIAFVFFVILTSLIVFYSEVLLWKN